MITPSNFGILCEPQCSKLDAMANLAQFDIGAKQQEFRIRALLEDLLEAYVGGRPGSKLALAVWFKKSLGLREQNLLLVYGGVIVGGITEPERVPLYWKTGSPGSPVVSIEATDVEWFSKLQKAYPQRLLHYQNDCEVLYFDKNLLSPGILDIFRVITEPSGLIKGWYVDQDEFIKGGKAKNIGGLLSIHRTSRAHFGLVKTEEKDFETCRGILHIEASQLWVPMSPDGLQSYSYYNDWQQGRRVYFLFEGGALYQVLQFEVRTEHDYANRFGLLRETPNDRYSEVYLQAVRPPA